MIHRNYLRNCEELEKEAMLIKLRPAPTWLGNFEFCMFGKAYGKDYGYPKLPYLLGQIQRLSQLVPDQVFTTYFLQKYSPGSVVNPHKDPKNNMGMTVIGIFGNFTGAESTCENKKYQLNTGDAVVQPCTVNGIQGPRHSVSAVESGIRWALILNTIE